MKTINENIQALCIRSNQQLKTAQNSAQQGDYGSATSLLVTAFEERTKAVVLQIVDLGFPIMNDLSDLEYIFRQHDARHYIGFFVDCFYEIIEDFKLIIERYRNDKSFKFNIVKFDEEERLQQDLLNWGLNKIDSFIKKIDFYQNIEQTRQNGLYVDVLNHKFTNELTHEDFLFVKSRLNMIHLLSKDLLEMKEIYELDLFPSIDDSIQKLTQTNISSHLVNAIQLVKKERSKVFNSIKFKLNSFRKVLIESNIKKINNQ